MKEIPEWGMVQELIEMILDLETDEQKVFVYDLFNHLDPHLPFLDQCSEKQLKWLYALHDFYCNENEEAFDDWDDEDD